MLLVNKIFRNENKITFSAHFVPAERRARAFSPYSPFYHGYTFLCLRDFTTMKAAAPSSATPPMVNIQVP